MVVTKLIWDTWNVDHIARHSVMPDEVEEVCKKSFFASQTYERRIRIIGKTRSGKILTIILAPKGRNEYYPVTARSASHSEQRIYIEKEGGEV